jgi:acetylornithine deacetylase/succinyl-diaminopimelate desuccinylase-like protein
MEVWKKYQAENENKFLEELKDLLRIASVSAKSEHNADTASCAEAVKIVC